MSINLYCEQMELWQTPTYITYMCYSNNDGGWMGVRYRYTHWVKSHLNGVWKDIKAYEERKSDIDEHLRRLHKFKELKFYTM